MAKTSLRAYNREVESLIEQGHIDEAIAQCRHILRTFPKCLDTYRLLGKAYLEARRYSEAEDIFRRLLLAVPDDFIANLGMSIISDEQKSVNNAIWFMERAFEVQPSNTAVQSELRRLYGRRDGLEPPQIRLTRGALAQMYGRGNQIQQAIAEVRAILADDPDRMDLQVLLARAYFRGGQKVEATDVCTELLKKYPYCLDANRIMVEILSDASRSDSTQIYRHRVNALDPYSAFVPGSLFDVADVPDQAVTLEKMEFMAEEFTSPTDFGYKTAEPEAPAEEHEAWSAETEAAEQAPAAEMPQAEQAEEIPDWLRVAGWGAATEEAVRRADMAAHEEQAAAEPSDQIADELAQAEVPDWVKAMAPPEAAQAAGPAGEAPELASAEADTEWLAGLGLPEEPKPEAAAEATQVGVTAAALAAAAAMMASHEEPKEEEQVPSEQVPAQAPEMTPEEAPVPSEEAAAPAPEMAAAEAEELPDWLAAAISAEGPQAGTGAEEGPGVGAFVAGAAMAAAAQENPLPEATAEAPIPAEEEVPEDVSAWLAGLDEGAAKAAEAGAAPEEAGTLPEEFTMEEMPAPESGAGEPSPRPVEEMSEEEAFAWLESLAAKQGASADELLTTPEERGEPAAEEPGVPAAEGPGVAETLVGAAAAGMAGAMLSRDDEHPEEEKAAEVQPEAELPGTPPAENLDWLEGIEKEVEAEEASAQAPPVTEWLPEEARAEETPAAVEEASAETPAATEWLPEEARTEETPAMPQEAEQVEIPGEAMAAAMLAGAEMQKEPEAGPAEVPAEEEMPEWLRASLEGTPQEVPAAEELPDWMKALRPEPALEAEPLMQQEASFEAVAEPLAEAEEAEYGEPAGMGEAMAESNIEIARPTPPQGDEAIFELAQMDLQRGNLEEAAAGYSRLIRRGRLLDEIIFDLREATYRYPVDVVVWLTLGDACKRANRLQDALDAYTKAEELLR